MLKLVLTALLLTSSICFAETTKVQYFLSSMCGCSESMAKHLAKRGLLVGLQEEVYIVSPTEEITKTLTDAKFSVTPIKALDAPNKFDIEGLPAMKVISDKGEVLYAGGFTEQYPEEGVPILDLEILDQLFTGKTPEPLPTFGCVIPKT